MFDEFTRAADTAGLWAQRQDVTEHSRRLARIISAAAKRLARSPFLDLSEVACFETVGCHLCWRVGEIRCECESGQDAGCPLGMEKIKVLERSLSV